MLSWLSTLAGWPSESPVADPLPDDRLVALAQADRRAFAALYDRYLEPVYGYCYRLLGRREAAEDAASQTFCNALQALPRYRSGSFRAWLFTIAHNVVVDAQRKQHPEDTLTAAGEPMDRAPSPEEWALAAEERRFLQAVLARLPADQRRLVELRLAGLSGAEIAALMGRSPAAIKQLQFRAMERLRALLRPRAGSEEVRDGDK